MMKNVIYGVLELSYMFYFVAHLLFKEGRMSRSLKQFSLDTLVSAPLNGKMSLTREKYLLKNYLMLIRNRDIRLVKLLMIHGLKFTLVATMFNLLIVLLRKY